MATFNFVDYKPEHLDLIDELRYADWYAFRSSSWREHIQQYLSHGLSKSLFVTPTSSPDPTPLLIMIINLHLLWSGVGEFWALAHPRVVNYPLTFCKATRNELNKYIKALKLQRLQCKIIVGYLESNNWVQWLGFKPEAYMEKYGPLGEDYTQWAWIASPRDRDASESLSWERWSTSLPSPLCSLAEAE